MKKIIFLFFALYFLILFQTGFLNFLKVTPNFILLLILLLVFFEKDRKIGLIAAFLGGFFLDIFSTSPFGTATLSLILIYALSILLLRIFLKTGLIEFVLLIIISAVLYYIFIPSLTYLFGLIFNLDYPWQLNFNLLTLIETVLNLFLGIISFYLVKKIKHGILPTPTKKRIK